MESASRRRARTPGEALASRSLRGPDEVQFAFHPTLTRLWSRHRVGAANGSSKLQATIGRSTVLGWWTGAMGGLMAGLRQDEQLMSFATRCVRRWPVRASRGRVTMIIADNLKTHTAQGSLLVREPG